MDIARPARSLGERLLCNCQRTPDISLEYQHLVPTLFRSGSAKFTPKGNTSCKKYNEIPSIPTIRALPGYTLQKNQKAPPQILSFVFLLRDVFRTVRLLVADVVNPTTNKNTEWDGGKSFSIPIFLPQTLNKAAPSVPITSFTCYILANDLPLHEQVLRVRDQPNIKLDVLASKSQISTGYQYDHCLKNSIKMSKALSPSQTNASRSLKFWPKVPRSML